ncbi:hypothetical protein U1Q18_033365 [Sarracenia purpurea var. burkii]
MAKRELSSTLRNLKFMQRAALREENGKKEEVVIPNGNFPSSGTLKRCIVVVEGDPHPGAIKGRMSFQSFSPFIDKLNEEATNPRQPEPHQPEASATCSGGQNGSSSYRSTQDGSENMKLNSFNNDANEELKRKQLEAISETQYPKKSQKKVQGDHESSPSGSSSHKQPKREKLDFSALRPPKGKKKRE